MRRTSMVTCLVLALAAGSAPAQQAGPVEVGAFLQWTAFDGTLRMDDFFASGVEVGFRLTPSLGIEGDISRVITNGPPGIRVSYLPIRARLDYRVPVRRRMDAHLGLGYVHNTYGASREGSDHGVSAMAGVRFGVAQRMSLRLDFGLDYMPSPANAAVGADHNWNYGVRQGLVVALGGRRSPAPVAPTSAEPEPQPEPLDSDGDGVVNSADRCPDTRPGTPTDAMGCPLDSDRDGVPDMADRCPDTPAGTAVDAMGCALDSDGDGVRDTLDRCPDTPAGTPVDANGCVLDGDGDGVPDAIDRCPGTAPGTRIDATGCLLLFEVDRPSLILEGVNFANNSAELTAESKAILVHVAASLAAHDSIRVSVDGHTSSTGTRAHNIRLSHARSESVKAYLVSRGIAPERLVARGFGPDRPIASNSTAEGQARNRRTELSKLD